MPYKIKTPESSRGLVVEEQAARFTEWIEAHHKTVIAAAIATVAVVLAAGWIWWSFDRMNRAAAELEYLAEQDYRRTQTVEGTERETALKSALGRYEEVMKQYPRSRTAPVAALAAAGIKDELEDTAGALAAYRELAARYRRPEVVLGRAYARMGYIFLRQGKADDAIAALSEAAKRDPTLTDQVSYEIARVYETQDRKVEAIGKYEQVAKEFAGSPWAILAAGRVQALGGGPQPEPSAPRPTTTAPAPAAPKPGAQPDVKKSPAGPKAAPPTH